ncbi:MAG: type II secretion system inner membrane protein GspF [Deltaproteobacteria bacterium]|nr:type II secretion system inner membrane protein GspF [Deltaproteobacteria bacterium]
MAVYEYVGFDGAGKSIKGVIDADNAKSARARLRKQGLFPTDVHEQQQGGVRGQGLALQVDFSKYLQRVTPQELSTVTQQMSTLVGANIPMVEALSALLEQTENPKLKAVFTDIREKVNEGHSLAKAMRAHPSVFDDLYVNMVDAGEQSGALDVVFSRLAAYTEASVALRGKLIAAVTYPIIMTIISGALVLGLFTFVIPRIQRIFETSGKELPLLTRVIFGMSSFVIDYKWYLIVAIPLAAYGARRWFKSARGRAWWHRTSLRMPVFGPLNRLVAVSRFCRTLATLLVSGVPILTALNIARAVVGNDVIAVAVEQASKNISEGQSIAVPLKASGQFPPIVTHMIAIGEKTGELEAMLSKVADAYDLEVENTVNSFTSLLAPILVVFMGVVVGIIALAVLLPMSQMASTLR